MEDTQKEQQQDQAAGNTPVKQFDQRTAEARPAPNQQNQANIQPGPTSADVTQNAKAMQEHITSAAENFAEVEKQAKESPAAEHAGLRGAIDNFKNTLEHLFKHAAHNVDAAQKAETAPAAATTTAAKSTATSDAHLNRGNGGAVTGNPAASAAQASAAQMAVDQGAKIPGVATVPQPDAAIR